MIIKFITSNPSKVKLANERLAKYGVETEQISLPLREIQSLNVEDVASDKAEQAKEIIKEPFIIEDSALEIRGLNNFPGALVKPIIDSLGEDWFIKVLPDGTDKSVTVVGQLIYVNADSLNVFKGTYSGYLAESARGEAARGWKLSRIFIPTNKTKTLAEMDDKEWGEFMDDFRKDDHYEKFGRWIRDNGV